MAQFSTRGKCFKNCTVGKASIFFQERVQLKTHTPPPQDLPHLPPPQKKPAVFFNCFNPLHCTSTEPPPNHAQIYWAQTLSQTWQVWRALKRVPLKLTTALMPVVIWKNCTRHPIKTTFPYRKQTLPPQWPEDSKWPGCPKLDDDEKVILMNQKTRGLWPCCNTGINSVVQKKPVTNAKLLNFIMSNLKEMSRWDFSQFHCQTFPDPDPRSFRGLRAAVSMPNNKTSLNLPVLIFNVTWAKKKKPPTLHYTGWLIGILIMVYYNPYIPG